MKHLLLVLCVAGVFGAVLGFSRTDSTAESKAPADSSSEGFVVEAGDKNPWTGLKPNANADQFQFAVVSDRTGGHRAGIFSRAVQQVNLLQPQFVMSVGDLIEGYTTKEDMATEQWDQFDGYVKKFEMPFFYVPGNHDMANKTLVQKWGERYGKRYYHFVYKNILFLCLCSENPPDAVSAIDADQREYVRKTLEANKGVRWTFVFVHKPIWDVKDLTVNGWGEVEQALAGRKYTVFCGHRHRYQKYVRNGMSYYQLATTGGGSRLRGTRYGEFDHVAWVTMKKDAPLVVNVLLDGILPDDLKLPETDEPGVKVKRLPVELATGTVTLDGKPLAAVTVTFHRYNKDTEKYARVADSLTDSLGRFQLSTYRQSDGCPVGDYAVTVAKTGTGYYDGNVPEKSPVPAKYATPGKTPLKAVVKEGPNQFKLELTGP